MLQGEGLPADTIVPPTAASLYEAVTRVVKQYPYDLRRAEQLMAEVGYSKGQDGVFTGAAGTFSPEVRGISEGDEGRETTIVADLLRRTGMDARLNVMPTAVLEDNDELKSTYPAFRTNQTSPTASLSAERMLGSRASAPANRWSGTNKMGWSNEEHDRLYDAWSKALDRDERTALIIQIARVTSEELPYVPMYFAPDVVAHTADLVGPRTRALQTTRHGNVNEWHWK
jgi:peptide/nickel transport system substrate-binding protein